MKIIKVDFSKRFSDLFYMMKTIREDYEYKMIFNRIEINRIKGG